jgi:peptidyl-prolyl cis-trans isomerase SurA
MRRALLITLCAASITAAPAAIIDRIAVSVGNRVITATDLDREIRITAFLNNAKPDFSAANKRKTAERMVDQTLIRSEIEVSRYLLPTAGEVDAALKALKDRYPDEAAYRGALSQHGISEDELRTMLLWQLTLVRFIDARFRPGIQISAEQIQKYFNEHVRPSLEQAHPGKPASLDDYREGIEQTLTGEAANQQVEQWLKDARGRTRIDYHEEVFR